MNSEYLKSLQSLNQNQLKAVETIDGPVLVIAGPGSGKTQILTTRIAHILAKTDALPEEILCVTFTDSAAINMRKRLRTIIGDDARKVNILTFHALGNEIMQRYSEYFYEGVTYSAGDQISQLEALQNVLTQLDYSNSLRSYSQRHGWVWAADINSRIGDLKHGGLTPAKFKLLIDQNCEDINRISHHFETLFSQKITNRIIPEWSVFVELVSSMSTTPPLYGYESWISVFQQSVKEADLDFQRVGKTTPITAFKNAWGKKDSRNRCILNDVLIMSRQYELAEIYHLYHETMMQKKVYDFDDMLLNTVETVESNDELRFNLQERFQYIMIDEFQDTNGVQMSLIHNLLHMELSEGRPNIFAVGDDDQSVYKFQRASLENMKQFVESFRDVALIPLEINYRSTQDILDVATEVIQHSVSRLNTVVNIEKRLISHKG